MITKSNLFLISILMCLSSILKAQSDTLKLSLLQAMDYAAEFGYQSINAQHDIEIAKRKVRETLAIGLPQITGSGAFTKNLLIQEVVAEFNGETQKFKMGTDYNSSLGVNAKQLLFDGSYFVGLRASRVYVQLSENAKVKTKIEIKKNVAEAYFLTLVAKQNIENFKKNLTTNRDMLKQAKAYFQNGLREDTEVDQIQLMVNKSKSLYLDAELQYKVALTILKFAIGMNIDKPLQITDSINELISSIPINTNTADNVKSHIDHKTLATQIDIQGLSIRNQLAKALPKLYASANYNYTMFGNKLNDLNKSDAAAIGLTLSVPIFSSGSRSAKLKQQRLELKKLEVKQQMLEQNLKKNFLVARTNLSNAKEQFENAKMSQDIAKRIFDKSLVKFKNGVMSSLDLSQNEGKLTEAMISFSQFSANYFNMYILYKEATSQL